MAALSEITSNIISALVIWNFVQHQRFNVNQKNTVPNKVRLLRESQTEYNSPDN